MRAFLLLALSLLIFSGIAGPAQADETLCKNAKVRAQLTSSAKNELNRRQAGLNDNWKGPNDFNSIYCGAQILNNFNQIGNSLASGVYSLVQNLLRNLLNQACQAAVAPLQNAASKLCVPYFTLPSFNLNLSLNRGFCSGMQLFTVNPVSGTNYGGPSGYTTPPLLP